MDEFTIGNDRLELSVDPRGGGVAQLLNRKTLTPYLIRPSKRALYLWFLQRGKKSRRFANDEEPVRVIPSSEDTLLTVERKDDGDTCSLAMTHDIDSVECLTRFALSQGSDLISCNIAVTNRSDSEYSSEVVGVGFPLIENVRIGDSSADEYLVRPNRFGEKIPDPVGKRGTYPESVLYGGFASMMWMDMYGRTEGLYLASYDKTLLMTALESHPNQRSGTMTLGMRKYAYVPPKGSWSSEPFIIGVHEGDWHWAADRYREWAETWMSKPSIPEDIKQMDGWYGVHFKPEGRIKVTFKDIERLFEDAEYLGLKHVQFWGQMVGDGCCYRFYYPDPRLGDSDELKSAISAVRKKGGRVGFYFNVQAFSPYVKESLERRGYQLPDDVKVPKWIGEFKDYAQVNFDGSTTVQYPGREFENDGFRIMCTCSKGWQDYLRFWIVDMYAGRHGADFAYIDQVFSPHVSYCFNFDHGHEHHGCSAQGRVSTLRRIVEEGRSVAPDFAVCIEGNGDSIGQHAALHLYTSFSSQTRYPAPEVFAYAFPDYIVLDGFANKPVDWIGKCYYPDVQGEVSLEDLMDRVYLLGFRFDVTLAEGVRRGEQLTEHIRDLIKLRKKIKHIQYNAKFVDDLGIRALPDKVIAKLFVGAEGGQLLINLVDYRDTRGKIRVELDSGRLGLKGGRTCALYSTGDKVLEVKPRVEGDSLVLDLPEFRGRVASVCLMSRP